MEITEVKVFPIHEEKLRAFVSIVFDHCFMVNDIKVIQGRDGLFISMPSRKKKNGEFKDIAHPLNNEARRTIEDRILAAFSVAADPARANPSVALGGAAPAATIGALGVTAGTDGLARGGSRPTEASPGLLEPRGPVAGGLAVEEPRVPEGKTLEELEELHLSDSFWSVT